MGQPGPARAKRVERVEAGGVEFFVELADGGGPQTAGTERLLSFDGVRDTVEAVAGQLAQVWDRVKPAEASVEFGLSLTAKAGKLTGLLVDADSQASLRVTLTWRAAGAG
ncbi:MAG TPA: CU044_2847 family protein [Micromonosporaceae bacterium]|nr:CU044_2847 family protein [Micromonosporaceae bacterium]